MTSRLSVSYSVLHCFFRSASEGFFWPFATGVFDFASTHFSKSGGSGSAAAPPCCWPLTAIVIHLSNSSWVMVESATLATAPAGTSLPQPVKAARPRAAAARAIRDLVMARVMSKRARRVAKRKSVAAQRAPPAACATTSVATGFGRDLQNRLRCGHDGAEALRVLVRQAHAHRLAT